MIQMGHLTRNYSYQRCLFSSIVFSFLVSLSLSDPRITEAGVYCGNLKVNSYIPTFVEGMEPLASLITNSLFATYHMNSTIPFYALAQCHHDLSQTECLLCYAAARTSIPRCLPSLSGRVYLDGCFLRYDNYSFYQESVSSSFDNATCSQENVSRSGSENERAEFETNVGYALSNVTSKAVENDGFGVVEIGGVYALSQCWDSVEKEGCRKCLEAAADAAKDCVPKKEGRGMNAGCYLRYSTEKFYNNEGSSGNSDGSFGVGVIIAIVLATTAVLIISLFAVYVRCIRLSKLKEERNNLGKIPSTFNNLSLNYKYETLEKATDFFSPSRRLGQGGAGSVFLATLPNGQTVAVKRLVYNTRQWADALFNEVNLISKIQHKNLVRLLGCSIEGPESLLVYEHVPNNSLDRFLFDNNKRTILTWKQRFNIIVGTAEGLAYLHGGSGVRIIHRDIKCSNVLLDENLNPKIADFGLVRCFGADKTHLSTGIAGTIGYMAPEYLVRGQLTEKADVYSFGVLALEIITGKKCNALVEDFASLLRMVWQLFISNRLFEAVDPCLKDDFPLQEATTALQIGLLCTQASAASRPSMAQVVCMLTTADCEIPMPNQPPFMNNNSSTIVQPVLQYGPSESSSMPSSDAVSRSSDGIRRPN